MAEYGFDDQTEVRQHGNAAIDLLSESQCHEFENFEVPRNIYPTLDPQKGMPSSHIDHEHTEDDTVPRDSDDYNSMCDASDVLYPDSGCDTYHNPAFAAFRGSEQNQHEDSTGIFTDAEEYINIAAKGYNVASAVTAGAVYGTETIGMYGGGSPYPDDHTATGIIGRDADGMASDLTEVDLSNSDEDFRVERKGTRRSAGKPRKGKGSRQSRGNSGSDSGPARSNGNLYKRKKQNPNGDPRALGMKGGPIHTDSIESLIEAVGGGNEFMESFASAPVMIPVAAEVPFAGVAVGAYHGVNPIIINGSHQTILGGIGPGSESHEFANGANCQPLYNDMGEPYQVLGHMINQQPTPMDVAHYPIPSPEHMGYNNGIGPGHMGSDDISTAVSHQNHSEPETKDIETTPMPYNGLDLGHTESGFIDANVAAVKNEERTDKESDAAESKTQIVKQEIEHYVEEADKYCMWSLNPQTGDHEFDPGPLAVDFYCNVCQTALPLGTFRIRCMECVDFDLCIPCACKGAEKNDHKNDHSYTPISPHSFTLFGDWNGDTELLLLEGISKYGFGNWNQVADMVNRRSVKNKSAVECENHYNEFYIHSPCSPFPDIRRMMTPVSNRQAMDHLQNFFNVVQQAHRDDKHRSWEIFPYSDVNVNHVDIIPPPLDVRTAGSAQLKFFQNFPGYNVYRDELDPEHNNDAESIIKDLEFEPLDTPAEVDFKLRVVEIYNSMLDDRIYHKRIMIHRFWGDYPTREVGLQSMNQIEKAAYWRLTPLMRFHTEEDHLKLTKLIVARIEIEKRLRLVSTWHSLGLRTLEEVEKFGLQRFPSAHATGQNAHMHPIARSLLSNGFDGMEKLDEFSEQQCMDLCNDLLISRDQMDELLTEIGKLSSDLPVFKSGSVSVIPTWDYCFSDSSQPNKNVPPVTLGPLTLAAASEEYWHPRIVLEGSGPHEIPEVDISGTRFSSAVASVVQQSQAFSGVNSCVYVAKFIPQYKSGVRKTTIKRRRRSSSNEYVKRGGVRR
ncbi:Transcriptional adapter ADA2b [Babesia sp. Xinjiang]|uniref:Transcriptional adapter ADA2b n=1 Tax=Babesia sp. Xinjiang TaxID=462227 RepID=UPI000A21FE13|nr:Transcriptional adapter ADA2b [Babesia sp. Xinjiang]ORM40345.1 Transcriptional adapter ADA2b [Babesia sp. Xinjiang]